MTKRLKILLSIYILIFTTTMGCSTIFRYLEYEEGINPELQEYIDYVNHLNKNAFSSVNSINFYYEKPGISDKFTIGFCSFSILHMSHFIKINKFWWKDATDRERILLIAHELKHCACPNNWQHIDRKDNVGCSTNYMSSLLPTSYCISKYYNTYLKQISKGCYDR